MDIHAHGPETVTLRFDHWRQVRNVSKASEVVGGRLNNPQRVGSWLGRNSTRELVRPVSVVVPEAEVPGISDDIDRAKTGISRLIPNHPRLADAYSDLTAGGEAVRAYIEGAHAAEATQPPAMPQAS